MKAVAYCRVSTNKDEQLDSMEAQQAFFGEYARRNNYQLIDIYADEGKSGTKMRNRQELLRLLSDASKDVFQLVLIKDVSRLARNTVDFLTSIRKLKALGIKVVFVNYDQTSSESSEFMLTMLSAIAQEESANTSKRVKFGKRINAEKGKVPNLVYGYDKIPGEYYTLSVNEKEADIVREIFRLYTAEEMGAGKIAMELNRRGVRTKRGSQWTQTAISRILTNRIYTGVIVNGKEAVEDFLTGRRRENPEDQWLICERPGLRIVEDEMFERAGRILKSRSDCFKGGKRKTDKHIFSGLIHCEACGGTFRRQVRTYRRTSIKWVCAQRNQKGADFCNNSISLDEKELLEGIRAYIIAMLADKNGVMQSITDEFHRIYKSRDENARAEKELSAQVNRLKNSRQKYLDMYEEDIISMDELKAKTTETNERIKALQRELDFLNIGIHKETYLKDMLVENFRNFEKLVCAETINNSMIAGIIDHITADHQGNVNIYLKLADSLGLQKSVPLYAGGT